MSLISWVRERLGVGTNDVNGWRQFLGGSTWAGKPVTATNALELSAWWRAVKLYAEVTGTTPIKFYERTKDGGRVQVKDHPVAQVVSFDPNADQTTQEFWGGQAAGLVVLGNAYAEKKFSGKRLVALEQLPFETHPYRDQDGDLHYRFTDRGKSYDLPVEKVFHTKGFGFGGDVGLSPLSFARQTLSITLATEEAAGQTFAKGMRASGYITLPAGIKTDKDSRAEFRKTFIDPMTGNNAEVHIGLLEGGAGFQPINIPPKDAEMLMSRRFNVEEIARFMGTPPILLGHSADGQTMWGTGIGAIVLQWRTLGLDAFFSTIEKSINKRLLTPEERVRYYAEFDRDALLQNDAAGKAEMFWKLIQIAGITPNQVCDKQNMPRFEGGDVRLVNSTLTPLATLGQKPAARIQPAPGEPIPEPTP